MEGEAIRGSKERGKVTESGGWGGKEKKMTQGSLQGLGVANDDKDEGDSGTISDTASDSKITAKDDATENGSGNLHPPT